MKDIEIANQVQKSHIHEIIKKLEIPEEYVDCYGKYKAKIKNEFYDKIKDNPDGKLVLVTAINPTPLGEGKTTIGIGLSDALCQLNQKSILALREPSLGPVFGMKGGATGGGYAQVVPMEEINLHFTGDIHAITSANNLLAAMIDNHIYFGNELKFKKVIWKRCVDLNDRALREIEIGLSKEKNMHPRKDGFDISVASEIMAIFCLATDLKDLKRRLGNIVVGYNEEDRPIYAKDLRAEGAMTVLLKEAFAPNVVQTLEKNPAFIHGGPFANIAHGCNSIVATKMALKLGDYVVTEAGFGADLGAEKFMDIKCHIADLKPDVVVCVATLKALKYHGGVEVAKVNEENIEALKAGSHNLLRHIDNLKNKFKVNCIVAINEYETDSKEEIRILKELLAEKQISISLATVWAEGGKGAIDLAQKVIKLVEKPSNFSRIYTAEDTIKQKIEKIAKQIYGAETVEYSDAASEEIKRIEKLGLSHLPVCIAKTQYSFSDDPKNLECKEPFTIHVNEIILKSGAEFVVVKTGKIFTMPGLPRKPAAESIDINSKGEITGIF